ncbi:hypothetical protein KKA47_04875 [bacterium]|nr:hypothetical protein [bacterium]
MGSNWSPSIVLMPGWGVMDLDNHFSGGKVSLFDLGLGGKILFHPEGKTHFFKYEFDYRWMLGSDFNGLKHTFAIGQKLPKDFSISGGIGTGILRNKSDDTHDYPYADQFWFGALEVLWSKTLGDSAYFKTNIGGRIEFGPDYFAPMMVASIGLNGEHEDADEDEEKKEKGLNLPAIQLSAGTSLGWMRLKHMQNIFGSKKVDDFYSSILVGLKMPIIDIDDFELALRYGIGAVAMLSSQVSGLQQNLHGVVRFPPLSDNVAVSAGLGMVHHYFVDDECFRHGKGNANGDIFFGLEGVKAKKETSWTAGLNLTTDITDTIGLGAYGSLAF